MIKWIINKLKQMKQERCKHEHIEMEMGVPAWVEHGDYGIGTCSDCGLEISRTFFPWSGSRQVFDIFKKDGKVIRLHKEEAVEAYLIVDEAVRFKKYDDALVIQSGKRTHLIKLNEIERFEFYKQPCPEVNE